MTPTIWGMDAGSWHRLDNVFAILSVQILFLYFADLKSTTMNDAVRWISLVVTLFCQQLSPWNIVCTIIPILFSSLIMFGNYFITQQLPHLKSINFILGFFTALLGIFFFQRGLDDENDYLRYNHSLWHAFAGLATYFFLKSKSENEYFVKIM